MNATYWVLDVEGSGSRPPEIVELAMLRLVDFSSTMERHWFVQPSAPIEPAATRIHGISDADVLGAPAIEDIAEDIVECLSGFPIVGHNVRIDVEVLSRSIPEWKPHIAIDTLKLAKLLLPGKESYALSKLGADLGIDAEARKRTGKASHSALYDATLTALLFTALLEPLASDRRQSILQECDVLYKPQGNLL